MKIKSKDGNYIVNLLAGKIRLMKKVRRGDGYAFLCIRNQRFSYFSPMGWFKAIKWVM